MKGSMNILRLVVFGMMVGLFATSAFADSVQDPKIIIRDPACQPPGCTPVGTSFTFGTPQSGTGALFFNNAGVGDQLHHRRFRKLHRIDSQRDYDHPVERRRGQFHRASGGAKFLDCFRM